MKEESVRIDGLPAQILDLDLAETGGWVAVTGDDKSKALSFSNGKTVPLGQSISHPLVRALGRDTAVLVDSRTSESRKNGFIIDASGKTLTVFYAGDGIADVLTSGEHIVVTYFDEGVYSGGELESNGVAVFNRRGGLEFGYQSQFGKLAADVSDCYAASWDAGGRLLFFPYTDFPLVSIDLKSREQRIDRTPAEVAGAHAISPIGDRILFVGPYKDGDAVFSWEVGTAEASRIGAFQTTGPHRGLAQGRFLSVGTSGYTVTSWEP